MTHDEDWKVTRRSIISSQIPITSGTFICSPEYYYYYYYYYYYHRYFSALVWFVTII